MDPHQKLLCGRLSRNALLKLQNLSPTIHDICYDLKSNLQENAEKICEMTRKEN